MASDRTICTPSDGLGESIQKVRALHGRTSGPTRRSTKGQWTPEEDEILQRAVQRFKGKNWKKIAECFKDRTDVQCLHRWQKVLNPELVKGPWSKEEDEIIVELVNKYGPKKWSTIAQHLPGRIGKQCRERWHNHLNPSINKEAWTQDEELALIRAHQIYGNKWAELTKFLPGRTDNSIKNHWNSSVKKKLDSYLKSGLLTHFQGLPPIGQQNQPMLSSSLRVQNSGDDSVHKGTEIEEISECSQDSTVAGRLQSSNEMALIHREEPPSVEVPGSGKELKPSPANGSEPYFPDMEEPAFDLTDMSQGIGFVTNFLQQNFSHDAETSTSGDYQFDSHEMHNISSLELGHESLGNHSHCLGSNDGHEVHNVQLQAPGELTTCSMGQMHMGSDKAEHVLISDDECCRILFTEAMKDECFSAGNLDLGGDAGPSVCQSSDIQISSEVDGTASQLHRHSNYDIAVPSCSQSLFPRHISADGNRIILAGDSNNLFGVQEQEYATCSRDGFIYTNDSANSPCDNGTDLTGMREQLDKLEDASKLVPVNSFNSRLDTPTCPADAMPNVNREEHGAGALCYEPPRFPSFDVPFFSCDLIQSGSEMQQEYSPLGIRQLMMSSTHCLTPFRLWDSPTRGDSPDAVLKSAAKTFTGTPSILKKRHREFMSPLSDRRKEKKLETNVTSRLTKDFSRLDVFVDEDSGSQKASSQSPSTAQNPNSANPTGKQNQANTGADKETQDLTSEEIAEQGTAKPDDNKAKIQGNPTSEQPAGVLLEHNMNNLLLFSPKQLDFRAFGSSGRTPRSQLSKSSCGKPRLLFSSPSVTRKAHGVHPVSEAPGQQLDSSSTVPDGCDAGSDATTENFSIFGETPFKRSIESPSAWKSPWFINSFIAGPRVDTDITIEDIGYFMSPGDRSYDAIGLMKQISEQTAAAYANAQEVLGNETPQTFGKGRRSRDMHENVPSNQLGNRSNLHKNIMAECRVLDFSECGTPGKAGAQNSKSSTAIGLSSPSSYLLKSCR